MCTLRDHRCISAILKVHREQFVEPCRAKPGGVNGTPMASQCSKVPVPFRSLAYCEGVHYGTEMDWDMMLEMYSRETVQVGEGDWGLEGIVWV